MDNQLTADGAALHLFFTDDVYFVNEPGIQYDGVAKSLASTPVDVVSESVVKVPLMKQGIPAIPVPIAATVTQQTVEFRFLGKNKRNILILVNDEQNEVSDEAGRELLRKIVKSVNLTANDFALLNYAGYKGTGLKQLQEYFSCNLVFAFGVTPAHLGIGTAYPEHVIVLEDAVKMIFSAELKTLDQNPAGKKALWGSLQNLGL
ncbi:hypothetical protein [Pedobacter nyackensis]|uniref:hypothetical protein n=1 Tax=Pedobacter nyackensis TaxID=475255 RepID=UPI00292E7F70|nr:hypothetical protein [Pedobacter nyackensis]